MQETLPGALAPGSHSVEVPAWKSVAGHAAAAAIAVLFVVAGVWKITNPFTWSTMLEQLQVWYQVSLPFTIGLGIAETFAGVLILLPRFRRWGAWLTALLLVVFMVYVGWNYTTLIGKECSCFPWVKRTVGPGFFVGDVVMLALAALAGFWAKPSQGLRVAAVALGAISVFAAVNLGVAYSRETGTEAPESIVADGQPFALRSGRVFLYFYDPMCMHCDQAAREMAKYKWAPDVRLVALHTAMPQFAAQFLKDTGFRATSSPDWQPLKAIFPFGDAPFGVALERGRQKAALRTFAGDEPKASLQKLGFVE